MMLKKFPSACILLLLFGNMQNAFCQYEKNIDSLKNEITKFDARKKQLGDKASLLSDTIKIRLLGKIAGNYLSLGSPETVKYCTEQLAMSEKLNYYFGIGSAHNMLGSYYSNKGMFEKALLHQYKSLAVNKKSNDKHGEFSNYNNIGIIYSRQGKYPEALQNMLKTLEFAKRLHDYDKISASYNNIGNVYNSLQKSDKALQYYKLGLKEQIKNKDYFKMAYTYQNIADAYVLLNQSNVALEFYQKGLKHSKDSRNFDAEAGNLTGIGKTYYTKGNFSKALEYFLASTKMSEEIGDLYAMATSYNIISNTYLSLDQEDKALFYAKKGMQLAQENEAGIDMLRDFHETISDIYAQQGKFKDAYQNYVVFKQLNDSMFNMEKHRKITEMQLNYDFKRKQDEQQLVQQKKDAAVEITVKKQRDTTHFVLLVLALVTLFAIGVYYNLRRNQRQRKIIEEQKSVVEHQNTIIQNSLTEKETLLREIHHRVKNNLQIISSLLNIQSENISDKNVLSSIQEGQSRVQAMSLIHQNLYQSEHINNVNIENYLKELVISLSQMFGADDKNIAVEINASGLEFDIDTAIPLGLIVNELVSNAYKYAFQNTAEGMININIKSKTDKKFELSVSNNGDTLPQDFDIKNSPSLGLRLVSMLSKQLYGKFRFESNDESTSFLVSFKG